MALMPRCAPSSAAVMPARPLFFSSAGLTMTTWSHRPEKPSGVVSLRSATSFASCGRSEASANAATRSSVLLFMMRFQVGMKLKNSALSIWKKRRPGRGLICG